MSTTAITSSNTILQPLQQPKNGQKTSQLAQTQKRQQLQQTQQTPQTQPVQQVSQTQSIKQGQTVGTKINVFA